MAPRTGTLSRPLIIGGTDDEHVAAVVEHLDCLGVEPITVDTAKLEQASYRLINSCGAIDGDVIDFRERRKGWIRRLAPPQWRRGTVGGSELAAERSAWSSLLMAFAGETNVQWLTPIGQLFFVENKLLQLRMAERLGIRTPKSAVVPSRDMIPDDFGDELVVKPLGAGHFTGDNNVEWVVYATPLNRDAPELDHLAPAPFLIQERLHAEHHLRIVTVNRRVWACELDARELAVDWRKDEHAHHQFVPTSNAAVESAAAALATAAGLGYSSQDWIIQQGEPYLLDLNPAGQWLFLPDPVTGEVSREIATWLTEGIQ